MLKERGLEDAFCEGGEGKRGIRYGYVSLNPWPLQSMYFLQGILYAKMEGER